MSQKITTTDIICEFLEVITHSILYSRRLYPATIFVPKKKYGVPVYQSIHPDVNEYISQCMKAVNFHVKKKQLRKLFISFHTSEITYETYIFELLNIKAIGESDPLLINLEQSLRNFLLKLNTTDPYLAELPEDCTFSIKLLTTTYSNLEFNQDHLYEDFPWILVDGKTDSGQSLDIVPIYTLEDEFLNLQMYIEKSESR